LPPMNPRTARRRAASRSPARHGAALVLSLLFHALLMSMQFGLPGLGLPGLELPWNERRGQATGLTVRLANVETAQATPPPPPVKADTPVPRKTAPNRRPVKKPAALPPPPLPKMEAPPLPAVPLPALALASPPWPAPKISS